eukprot:10043929-Karenia_brevis.AAC.1
MAVQIGSQRGAAWAGSAARRYARTWASVASILEDDVQRVIWMPAHCTSKHEGMKTLSNGQPLSRQHRIGNATVDGLAKDIAREDAPPRWQMQA